MKRFEPEGSQKHREVNNNIKRCMKKAKENLIGEQCSEIEESLRKNNSKRAYDYNNHLRSVLDKHAPLCRRKSRSRKPTPWFSSIAEQFCELKRERRKVERRWLKSKLTVHKQIYDSIKQKVTDLVSEENLLLCKDPI